jgi:CubicO group peptidase (beta-lactamase class C family)
MAASTDRVNEILNQVPHLRRGTGGVAAVVKDGKVVGKKVWGYADLDQRIPMTMQTVFPICSISKQMVCLVMQSLLQKPTASMAERKESPEEQMEAELHKLLPHLKVAKGGDDLKVADLYNMQSGIRDYWAM